MAYSPYLTLLCKQGLHPSLLFLFSFVFTKLCFSNSGIQVRSKVFKTTSIEFSQGPVSYCIEACLLLAAVTNRNGPTRFARFRVALSCQINSERYKFYFPGFVYDLTLILPLPVIIIIIFSKRQYTVWTMGLSNQ